jgi:hypothetical protein
LVLGLATAANASLTGITLSINGSTMASGVTTSITIPVCTTLDIDVSGPQGYMYLGYVVIQANPGSGGEWGDNIASPPAGYYAQSGYPIVQAAAGTMASTGRYVDLTGDWGFPVFGYTMTAATAPGTTVAGGDEFDYAYHCASAPNILTVTLWDDAGGYTTPQDTIIVHQIPEPITLTLLGLGGLLLRRRK